MLLEERKICTLPFPCFHPSWYVYLIRYSWIYENVIITSNIMQSPFHGLLTSSHDILQFQAIIVAGQTAAAKWYHSLTHWWRWADFMRLSFPCSESDAQVWLEADGQKHMHACCHRDQLDRSLILTQLCFLRAYLWLLHWLFVQIVSWCCRVTPI